ncbi:MAG TPA: hypothetical protein VIZ86_16800, partial [Pseudomonas sp.]
AEHWKAEHLAGNAIIDQLRAKVEMLRRDRKACLEEFKALRRSADETERDLRAEVEALRKDKDRLDAIEGNCWDVRYGSSPNGDAGDSSISIEIVGHFMAEPCERVLGENCHENLRAAIDQAMTADAYPPARPEYEDPEDWDGLFPDGSGNKSRRRAEALGIDYDAAMAAKEGV